MARSRREKTLADYVVIAISPALIMTLVGSLAFFLLEVSYRGQYRERLMWVLFCYVFGAVLVARIAIEEGKERANLFGLALAAATGFFAFRFVDTVAIAWTLLAVIWWCAWKLVFDCTLIDDDEDASGEGLLQAAGFDRGQNGTTETTTHQSGERRDVSPPVGGASQSAPLDPNTLLDSGLEGPANEAKRRPHSPGLWVVYFSLAALPLFGVGQLFIPMAEADRRSYVFQLLALYVASALGLLLSTSFLGLRRYLRQRKLQMPAAMTGSWIGMGAGMALVLLLLALVIPRPQGEYTLTQLVDKIDEKARAASKVAMLGGDRGEGEGRRIGQQDRNADQPGEGGKPPEQQSDGQNAEQQKQGDEPGQNSGDRSTKKEDGGSQGKGGEGQSGGKKNGQGKSEQTGGEKGDKKGQNQAKGQGAGQKSSGEKRPGENQSDPQKNPANGRAGDQQQQGNNPPQAPRAPAPSSLLGQLAASVKWIIYAALALAGLYLLYRNWSRFVAILTQLWAELVNLWNSLFGGKPEERGSADESEGTVAPVRLRPFASYENPFFSGADRRMTPAQLALYTFDALEAWSREKLVPRPPEQTPLEFADAVGALLPDMSRDVKQTALLYARVVYAKKSPTKESVEVLERMWRRMGA